jgi:adenylate cyclase
VRPVQIVDVGIDPEEARRERWRRIGRVGLPLLLVGLIIASLLGIALHSYRTNRDDALELSQELIEHLDQRIQNEVSAYLWTASNATEVMAGVLANHGGLAGSRDLFEPLAIEFLEQEPELASLYAGAPDGDFIMVQRSPAGALDTKLVEREAATLEVTWTRRDEVGRVVAREPDPKDRFDPRTRPWYAAAQGGEGVFWSDVYVFFTTQDLGITVSSAVRSAANDLEAVVGADISLAALGDFLAGLEIGRSGRAMIVTREGGIIGLPREAGADPAAPARVADLKDPVLAEALDRTRVSGPGRSIVKIDGVRHIVAAADLAAVGTPGWMVLIVVPEEDFTGFVAANSSRSLLLSGGTVALTLLLAGLLGWQGLATERTRRTLRERGRALAAQTSVFDEIAAATSEGDGDDQKALRRMTELAAGAVSARRVSVWQQMDRHLLCRDCFDRETGGHTSGGELRDDQCPTLCDSLLAGEELDIRDATLDPRTAELHAVYLKPMACRSLVSAPIRRGRQIIGALWIEDAAATGSGSLANQSLARIVAHMLAGRLDNAGQALALAPLESAPAGAVAAGGGGPAIEELAGSRAALRTASIASERREAFLRQIPGRGLTSERVLATVFPDTTVLVLTFLDDLAIASAGGGRPVALIEHIVDLFQRIAERLDVRYVKILGDQIVAIEGFEGDIAVATGKLADVALELREHLSSELLDSGRELAFGIGLDTGTVMGAPVGFGRGSYNVWGETVRVSALMAATAPRGTVQCTEATYEHLRRHCLLRRRGSFYIENLGEMSTYALRGRL